MSCRWSRARFGECSCELHCLGGVAAATPVCDMSRSAVICDLAVAGFVLVAWPGPQLRLALSGCWLRDLAFLTLARADSGGLLHGVATATVDLTAAGRVVSPLVHDDPALLE